MAELFANAVEGTLSSGVSAATTTLSSGAFAALPVVSGGNYVKVTIDPDEENGSGWGAEIVHVTVHTSASATVTVVRAQEGTTARDWPLNTKVVAAITKGTLETLQSDVGTAVADASSAESQASSAVSTANAAASAASGASSTANAAQAAISDHIGSRSEHPVATNTLAGFMSSSDKAKLDAIEANAKDDMTATEIREALKTVDGPGSGVDADLLDGQQASAFAPAGHGHSAFGNLTTGSIDASSYIDTDTDFRVAGTRVVDHTGALAQLMNGNNPVVAGDGVNDLFLYGVPFGAGAWEARFASDVGDDREVLYYTIGSSRELKENEVEATPDPQLLLAILPLVKEYNYKADPDKQTRLGWVIEDLQDILPDAAFQWYDGKRTKFDEWWFIATLAQAFGDLEARVSALEG